MTLYEPRSGVSMHHYHLIENNSRPHAACCETYTLMSLYPFHMNILSRLFTSSGNLLFEFVASCFA
jgi:hypothetical protein